MTKDPSNGDNVEESVPLHNFGRSSLDSTNSQDLNDLLSNDTASEASSSFSDDGAPVDGGRDAWLCLLGCWLIEAMLRGFPLAFGVFQRYYSAHPLFEDSSSSIPTIGTLATGIASLGMPFANPIALRWPQYRTYMTAVGWLTCLIGLTGASFATKVWQLLLFQGFLFGTGWVVCYTPQMFILNEHFSQKRGLVYGILFSASGVSGLIIPEMFAWMLGRFGFRTALRGYVVATVVLTAPGFLLMKPRKRRASQEQALVKHEKKTGQGMIRALKPFITGRHFLLFAGAIFMQALGYLVPNIYIVSYAEDLGLLPSTSSGLLAILALAQVLGQLWQGWVSDKVNIHIPLSVSTLIPGMVALLLWGPAKGMAYLAPFAFIWGFFSASYTVLFTRICTYLTTTVKEIDDGDDDTGMLLYGAFRFERGIADILQGPISSWLIFSGQQEVDVDRYGLGRYASVVWFSALCMFASSLVGVGWLWRPRQTLDTHR